MVPYRTSYQWSGIFHAKDTGRSKIHCLQQIAPKLADHLRAGGGAADETLQGGRVTFNDSTRLVNSSSRRI